MFAQVRVAHFEPNKITLTGEGVFPRVIFDLPPDKEDFRYDEIIRQARESLGREKSNLSEKTVDDVPFRALADVSTAFHDNLLPFAFTQLYNANARVIGFNHLRNQLSKMHP